MFVFSFMNEFSSHKIEKITQQTSSTRPKARNPYLRSTANNPVLYFIIVSYSMVPTRMQTPVTTFAIIKSSPPETQLARVHYRT
jgi:hypothetical protein